MLMSVRQGSLLNSPIVGQVYLWTKTQQLAIKDHCTAIISAASVHKRESHVNENAMKGCIR